MMRHRDGLLWLPVPILALALFGFGALAVAVGRYGKRRCLGRHPCGDGVGGLLYQPRVQQGEEQKATGIYIKQVTSIYEPYSPEPFSMDRWLGAGKTVTFQTGAAAATNRPTTKYIYNNSVGTQEGAKVVTSVGTFYDRCD